MGIKYLTIPKSGTVLLLNIVTLLMESPEKFITKAEYGEYTPGANEIGHLKYSDAAAEYLQDDKIVLLCRDPRDIALSQADAIYTGRYKAEYTDYILQQGLPHDAALSYMIAKIAIDVKTYYLDWIPRADLIIHYEELIAKNNKLAAPIKVSKNILKLSGETLPDMEIRYRLEQAMRPELSTTYNRGEAGRWKMEYKPFHIELFNNCAPNLLKEMGYDA